MKKYLFFFSIAIIMTSCNNDRKGEALTISLATNLENVDSLAHVVPLTWKNLNTVTDTLAHSGTFASLIDTINEYSITYENTFNNINDQVPVKAKVSAFGYSLLPDSKAIIVVSVNNNEFYTSTEFDSIFTTINQWKEMTTEFTFPKNLKKGDTIKAYVWNKKKGALLVDDLKFDLIY